MPHYGILREYTFEDINDVRGSEVYGVNDEKLGTIEDVIFDHATGDIRYIVLKTGNLLSRKRTIVPANRIEAYGNHEDKFYAELDKERLEMLPEFEAGVLRSEQDWSIYEKEYESRLNEGAIMYNKDTGRIVTPPTEEIEAGRRRPLSKEDRQSLERDFTPQRMGKEDSYLGVGSASENTTLRPQKPSMGGKADVDPTAKPAARKVTSPVGSEIKGPEKGANAPLSNLREPGIYRAEADIGSRQPPREVMSPIGSEIEIPPNPPNQSTPSKENIKEAMREPGIYKVDQDPELVAEANRGSRWSGFQEKLRSGRSKIVVDCPHCASQDKVA